MKFQCSMQFMFILQAICAYGRKNSLEVLIDTETNAI